MMLPKCKFFRVSIAFAILVLVLSVNAQTPSAVERELISRLETLKGASNYGGSGDEAIQSRENFAIRNALVKYGSRSDILKFAFPKLSEQIFVTTSSDGKLRAYSWDTESGGTMHDFITVYQYRGKSGKVRAWGKTYTESIEDRGPGAFVHQIFQTNTRSGPIYLVVSTWIGSTSLAGQTISAFKINGENLENALKVIKTRSGLTNLVGFEYDFFSVVDRPERPIKLFFYKESNKSFRFPVVIQDEKAPQGRVTNKFITYRFDGKYFVKVS